MDIRRQQLEIQRLETEERLREAEARQMELANEEKELQVRLLLRGQRSSLYLAGLDGMKSISS